MANRAPGSQWLQPFDKANLVLNLRREVVEDWVCRGVVGGTVNLDLQLSVGQAGGRIGSDSECGVCWVAEGGARASSGEQDARFGCRGAIVAATEAELSVAGTVLEVVGK